MEKIHGGDIYSYNREMIDFSANISPLGMPQKIKEHVADTILSAEKYPDVNYKRLRDALAKIENVDCDRIICGNGAAELIFNIVLALTPKKVLLVSPTFAEYEKAVDTLDCEKLFYPLKEKNNFEINEDFLDFIDESLDMVFICQPNNPVGNCTDPELMIKIAEKCRENNVLAVFDECFVNFIDNGNIYSMLKYTDVYKNIFILKAFTKMFAVPGLRIGYGICSDDVLINRMYTVRQPWNISSVAEEAALAACSIYSETVEKTVKYINNEKKYLISEFKRLGIEFFRPMANYIFFKEKEGLKDKLADKGILIRACGNYRGLDGRFYRIAVKNHDDNLKLISALEGYIWQKQ